jgi:HipA-like protein
MTTMLRTIMEASFELSLGNDKIGVLDYDGSKWTFEYSDWFKNQEDVKPLTQFPIKNEIYTQEQLWPFFASRIPSTKQPHVEDYLKNNPDKVNNLAALLGKFASHSVNNPFTLRML